MDSKQKIALTDRIRRRARAIIKDRSLTVKEVAEAADMQRSALSSFLNGGRGIGMPTLQRLAESLNVDPSELVGP